MAVSTIEARKARAGTITVVAKTSAGAITAGLVAVAIQGITSRGAFLQLASRATVSGIAKATYVLHIIPRGVIPATSLSSQVLLRPASTAVVAVRRASRALASHTIISREARASARLAVTAAFI